MSITSHTKPKTKREVFLALLDELEFAVRDHENPARKKHESQDLIAFRYQEKRKDLEAWYQRNCQ